MMGMQRIAARRPTTSLTVLAAVEPLLARLLHHEVYELLVDRRALRIFSENHCYAVWDFMSLLKALQARVTGSFPWAPPTDAGVARIINEIVVTEETDERRDGRGHASHFELYLEAMQELGADLGPVTRFVNLLRDGCAPATAVRQAHVPSAAARFVVRTLHVCRHGETHELAADFVLGRESVIPPVFRRMVDEATRVDGSSVHAFVYYLDRHVKLDGEEHGPAGQRMLDCLCGSDERRWREAQHAAHEALRARLELWDGIARAITGNGH